MAPTPTPNPKDPNLKDNKSRNDTEARAGYRDVDRSAKEHADKGRPGGDKGGKDKGGD